MRALLNHVDGGNNSLDEVEGMMTNPDNKFYVGESQAALNALNTLKEMQGKKYSIKKIQKLIKTRLS